MGEAEVRAAFAEQAGHCARLGSPFTARLCTLLGERIDGRSGIGARLLGWTGDPGSGADALPLRLCGGLHGLVRSGEAPGLARLYPPSPGGDDEELWTEISSVLREREEALHHWLDLPPQTNEVGRSAVLMAGLLEIAERFRLPLHLYELGASAGLNLILDRYAHHLGGVCAGDPGSTLALRPDWEGPPPPDRPLRIVSREAVDLSPLDPVREGERLLAYAWPDQRERIERLEKALAIAAADPPAVAQGDAAEWLEAHMPLAPAGGVVRTVMHSVAFQYFPGDVQERIAAWIAKAGADATEAAPVAWLRYENEPGEGFTLRLRTWPGGDRLLARAHAHGAWIHWLTGSEPLPR